MGASWGRHGGLPGAGGAGPVGRGQSGTVMLSTPSGEITAAESRPVA